LDTVEAVSPVSPAHIALPDRYRVVRHIANGGMASVWEAHDELLDRAVAVKLLAGHLSEDERARKRFQREARAAAGLSSHQNVVTIYDVGEHDGRTFMVMELLRGGTVADKLRRGERPDPQRALRWLREAASALDTAHEAGVVHRDIKPANLLLDERGRLAVADFGIARLAWEEQVTQTGQVLGTASYISPEQAMGDPATAASDRYALAVVAFELLTGRKPFSAEHFAAQARAHVEDPPPHASELAPELPRAVDEVLERGLAKDPHDRWPSAAELVERLETAFAPRRQRRAPAAAPAAPVSRMRPAARGSKGAPPRPRRTRSERDRLGPGRSAALAALVGVLAAAIVAVVLLSGGGGQDANRSADSGGGTSKSRATPTATAQSTPTATPDGTAAPEQTPAPSGSEPAGTNPLTLQVTAFRLNNAGRSQEALPYAKKAVDLCQGSTSISPCGYALYEYGKALRLTGNPQAAIPLFEERLRRFPQDQRKTVEKELRQARKAAGG
jgi:predicted Ser/Thr protein kinase